MNDTLRRRLAMSLFGERRGKLQGAVLYGAADTLLIAIRHLAGSLRMPLHDFRNR